MGDVVNMRRKRGGQSECMSVQEAAYHMTVSEATVYAILKRGEVPSKRAGSRWLIPRSEFYAWLRTPDAVGR